jgi:hypothetical protein
LLGPAQSPRSGCSPVRHRESTPEHTAHSDPCTSWVPSTHTDNNADCTAWSRSLQTDPGPVAYPPPHHTTARGDRPAPRGAVRR